MHWQDIIISLGQWVMTAALLPSIFSERKPAISSSLLTGTVIVAFGVAYASLGLVSSVLSSVACALAWFILAYQVWARK